MAKLNKVVELIDIAVSLYRNISKISIQDINKGNKTNIKFGGNIVKPFVLPMIKFYTYKEFRFHWPFHKLKNRYFGSYKQDTNISDRLYSCN